jgi:hypothetical protein
LEEQEEEEEWPGEYIAMIRRNYSNYQQSQLCYLCAFNYAFGQVFPELPLPSPKWIQCLEPPPSDVKAFHKFQSE